MTNSVKVRGADEVARTLRAAADDLRALDAVNREAGALVARTAQRGAPRRTGRLASSITVSAGPDRVAVATVGVVYAGVQEGGWARRGISGRHYMRTGLQANQDAVLALYERAAAAAADQVRGA